MQSPNIVAFKVYYHTENILTKVLYSKNTYLYINFKQTKEQILEDIKNELIDMESGTQEKFLRLLRVMQGDNVIFKPYYKFKTDDSLYMERKYLFDCD